MYKRQRAKLSVTFREAWTIDQQLQVTKRESADRTKLYRVNRSDTLSGIAYSQYENAAAWRTIADANNLANPRLLEPGMVLTLPPIVASAHTGTGSA